MRYAAQGYVVGTPEQDRPRIYEKSEAAHGNRAMSKKQKCWDYTPDLGLRICECVAAGQSLTKIGRMSGMPSRYMIRKWEEDHPEFAKRLEKAFEDGADALADEIIKIADDVKNNILDPRAGSVAIDALKWTASKLKPQKYADRVEANITVHRSYVDDLRALETVIEHESANGQGGPLIDHIPGE